MTLPIVPLSRSWRAVCAAGAEERVGRAAELQPALVGFLDQLGRVLGGQRQRLLGIGVLAGGEDRMGHVIVDVGNGQVDDHLDAAVLEQVVDRQRPDLELIGARLGDRRNDVGDRHDLDVAEARRQPEIGFRDIAATDDADRRPTRHCA